MTNLCNCRVSVGAQMIAQERVRQIEEEGWTPEHDAEHENCELPRAARSYLAEAVFPFGPGDSLPPALWPWDAKWWKPSSDPIRNLVKAGALIAAEIDRLRLKKLK